ncbi:MAG TPA: chemotaxis protein CheC [bacterium]|nr:chemotaxis protein CheC [bacterium]
MGQEAELFNEFQLDVLREIGNIGSGHAATALSQMVGRRVDMSVTQVKVLKTDSIAAFLGGMEQNVAAVHMPVYGEICGISLVFFPLDRVGELCGMLVGKKEENPLRLTEMGQSAIKEVGSILTGAYLSALFRLMNLQMIHGVPGLAIDMAQAILDTVLVELEQKEEIAIVIETKFLENGKQLTGSFFLLPESGSLQKLFTAFSKTFGFSGNG